MAETACPSCGFSPLAEGSESCPECKTYFALNPLYRRSRVAGGHGVRKDEADLEATRTTLGGITDAVTANPLPAAALLIATALAWVLRCLGVLCDAPQPLWPLGTAA